MKCDVFCTLYSKENWCTSLSKIISSKFIKTKNRAPWRTTKKKTTTANKPAWVRVNVAMGWMVIKLNMARIFLVTSVALGSAYLRPLVWSSSTVLKQIPWPFPLHAGWFSFWGSFWSVGSSLHWRMEHHWRLPPALHQESSHPHRSHVGQNPFLNLPTALSKIQGPD